MGALSQANDLIENRNCLLCGMQLTGRQSKYCKACAPKARKTKNEQWKLQHPGWRKKYSPVSLTYPKRSRAAKKRPRGFNGKNFA